MAIDSAEKRKNVAATFLVVAPCPGVTPNASKDLEWRQEAAYGYSGIAPTQSQLFNYPYFRGLLTCPGKMAH